MSEDENARWIARLQSENDELRKLRETTPGTEGAAGLAYWWEKREEHYENSRRLQEMAQRAIEHNKRLETRNSAVQAVLEAIGAFYGVPVEKVSAELIEGFVRDVQEQAAVSALTRLGFIPVESLDTGGEE